MIVHLHAPLEIIRASLSKLVRHLHEITFALEINSPNCHVSLKIGTDLLIITIASLYALLLVRPAASWPLKQAIMVSIPGVRCFFANIRPAIFLHRNIQDQTYLLPATFNLVAVRGTLLMFTLLAAIRAVAGPFIAPGDPALRHDIQRLADAGVISGPVTSWPLAWGPILADISSVNEPHALPRDVAGALVRIRSRAAMETGVGEIRWRSRAAAAATPSRMRSFQNTPREDGELAGGLSWTGERFSVDLNATVVADSLDGDGFRADGSQIGVALGNFSLSGNTMDRWWGPGWDSSLILSSNARPIPAISLDRIFTDPFESKWLHWLGPWDLVVHFGRFEADRHVPNTRFFGMRFNFRPLPSLEIGFSRTAQWCGEGRPCGFDTFVDLLLGNDNRGDEGINLHNEPGNQLAGVDFRWAASLLGKPLAVYGQFIGEDEAGGLPSRFLGQMGLETSGVLGERWSYRWFGEFAATSCQFYQSSEIYNCAYNHGIYKTGYRYRGRAVGHAADNDTRMLATGFFLVDDQSTQWSAFVRYGTLNRGGAADSRNSLTPTRQRVMSLDLTHSRVLTYGQIEIGVGVEKSDDEISGETSTDGRAFLQWRSSH